MLFDRLKTKADNVLKYSRQRQWNQGRNQAIQSFDQVRDGEL